MRAMVLEHTQPVEEHPLKESEMPRPEPGHGEILIKVLACGACHTDLHTVEGDLDLPRLPLIPGHQVVGRVIKSGPGADRVANGERGGRYLVLFGLRVLPILSGRT